MMLVTALLLTVQAQTVPASVRAAADRIQSEDIQRDLDYIASDALMGRQSPGPGFDSAAAYIARRLRRAGLRPLGDNNGYSQWYNIRETLLDTANAYLQVGTRRLRYGDDFYLRAFPRPVTVTAPTVHVGHGWQIPDHDIDAYAGVDARGKIALATGQRGFPAGVSVRGIGRTFGSARSAFDAAHRAGAAALIMIVPADSGGERFPRSLGGLELDPPVPSAYAAVPLPVVVVRPELEQALRSERVTLHLPAAVNRTQRVHNIVAMIPGSDPRLRNEYVTLESHLDGAVGTRALNGDSIYNSADDNASGSVGNLAIAEQIARGPKPKRSLIFIWDSGEERGLWGTRHFVAHPPVPLENVVAHFNIDMIGANRAPGSPDSSEHRVTESDEVFLIGPGVLSAEADSLLERVNRQYNPLRFNRAYDRADHEFFYPRTDAGPFLERGVLTIGFTTGIHNRYHRPPDEARYLDAEKIARLSRSILVMAWMLADMPSRPGLGQIPGLVPRYP